jgi:hypothetical protein
MLIYPAVILVVLIFLTACNGGGDGVVIVQRSNAPAGDSQTTPENHPSGTVSYSTVADGIWPPQPVGVSNVQPYNSRTVEEPVRDVKRLRDPASVLAHAEVRAAIGGRFEVLSQYTVGGKGTALTTTEIEIYSYTFDRVVTVIRLPGGEISVSSRAAHAYQPAESPAEVRRAVALAAEHLLTMGYQTQALIGSGLLAHPTTAEFHRSGHSFYDQRIVYVSFGRGAGTTPLYRATVNLSTETVSQAGPL